MSTVQLWVSGILAILRVLISQSTEDIVLSRIQELSFSPYLVSCPTISRLRDGDSTSALEEHTEGRQMKNLPEETFARCVSRLVRGLGLSCGVGALRPTTWLKEPVCSLCPASLVSGPWSCLSAGSVVLNQTL